MISYTQANHLAVSWCQECSTKHLAHVHQQHWNQCWWTRTGANQWSACTDQWAQGHSLWCKEVLLQCWGCTHKRAQLYKGPWARAQGPKEPFTIWSEHLSAAASDHGDSGANTMGGCTHLVPASARGGTITLAPTSARGQALLPALVLKWDKTCLPIQGSQPPESHRHGSGQWVWLAHGGAQF